MNVLPFEQYTTDRYRLVLAPPNGDEGTQAASQSGGAKKFSYIYIYKLSMSQNPYSHL